MTPQLQQAIKLLQLSTLDLQHEVQEAIENNPMLEMAEEDSESDAQDKTDSSEQESPETAESPGISVNGESSETEVDEEWKKESIPDDLPVDTSWDDVYQSAPTSSTPSQSEDYSMDFRTPASETLQEHLLWQLNLTPMSDKDNLIGEAIVDAVNLDGMLTSSLEDIHSGFNPEMEIDLDEVQAVDAQVAEGIAGAAVLRWQRAALEGREPA